VNEPLPEHVEFARTYVPPRPAPPYDWHSPAEDTPDTPDTPAPPPPAPPHDHRPDPPPDPPLYMLQGSPASGSPAVLDTQFQRVPIGTANQVLSVDGTGSYPVWVTGGGGGMTNPMTLPPVT